MCVEPEKGYMTPKINQSAQIHKIIHHSTNSEVFYFEFYPASNETPFYSVLWYLVPTFTSFFVQWLNLHRRMEWGPVWLNVWVFLYDLSSSVLCPVTAKSLLLITNPSIIGMLTMVWNDCVSYFANNSFRCNA